VRFAKLVESVTVHVYSLWDHDLCRKLWIRIDSVRSENSIRSLSPLLVVNQAVNIDCEHEQKYKNHQWKVNQCRQLYKSCLFPKQSTVE